MTLLSAIQASVSGSIIVSNVGKHYTPEELAANTIGKHAVSFRTCGMTKGEREGTFRVE